MKKILIMVMVFMGSAAATEIKIASERLSYDENFENAKFVVNLGMKRAWIEYDVVEDDGEDDWYTEKRTKLSGLSLNPKNEVVYNDGANLTVCATTSVRTRRFTNTQIVTLNYTGACSFDYRRGYETVDDGFQVRTFLKDSIYLVIE